MGRGAARGNAALFWCPSTPRWRCPTVYWGQHSLHSCVHIIVTSFHRPPTPFRPRPSTLRTFLLSHLCAEVPVDGVGWFLQSTLRSVTLRAVIGCGFAVTTDWCEHLFQYRLPGFGFGDCFITPISLLPRTAHCVWGFFVLYFFPFCVCVCV